MIRRTFREPNFRWKGTDYKGDVHGWIITHAASRAELEKRLVDRGYENIAIEDYDFQQWKDRAAQATENAKAVVTGGGTSKDVGFKSGIWGDLKHHLFELFDGKCAYCESKVLHVASGDVEHYRPKRKVEEDATHPGYYWLAYDVGNLLPSCEKCNRARGKATHFKIAGTRARDPVAPLDVEQPLMLHPGKDDPEKHLAFAPGFFDGNGILRFVGTVVGKTPAGEETVKTCNLRRPDLVEERRGKQEDFFNALLRKLGGPVDELNALWYEVLMGESPYSAAILDQRPCLKRTGLICPEAAVVMAAAEKSAGAPSGEPDRGGQPPAPQGSGEP